MILRHLFPLVLVALSAFALPGYAQSPSSWRARLLADINAAFEFVKGPTPSELFFSDGRLFFAAEDDAFRRGLWVTDGTDAGTRLVLVSAGGWELNPRNFIVFRESVWFQGDYQSGGDRELFRTDGTAAGTVIVGDPESRVLTDTPMAVAGDYLYFVAYNQEHHSELWRTDGSAEGTLMIADLNPSFYSSHPSDLTPLGDRLLFSAITPSGHELWITDGSAEGTRIVADLAPGPPDSEPRDLTMLGQTLFFVSHGYGSSTTAFGWELWRSDGTESGTRMVADINPGLPSSDPMILGAAGTQLLFAANDVAGRALWATNQAGTLTRLADLEPLAPGVAMGSHLYFSARRNSGSPRLWRTNGTAAGTTEVAPIEAHHLAVSGGSLYFLGVEAHNDFELNGELYRSDGTATGTRRVKDIRPGGHSSPHWLTDGGGILYFAANDGINGVDLWRSDGTDSGTRRVRATSAAPTKSSAPTFAGYLDGRLLFTATDDDGGRGLWSTDGSPAGTFRIVDIRAKEYGDTYFDLMMFGTAGERFFFTANDGIHGEELWATDGSIAGTHMVKDLVPGPGSPFDYRLQISAAFRGEIYFPARDSEAGAGVMHRSDGTAAGTRSAGFTASQIAATNDFIYFTAWEPTIWRTDGNGPATVVAVEEHGLKLGPVVGNDLYYTTHQALKVIEGDSAPRSLLDSVSVSSAYAAGSRVFVFDYSGLWVTDGTGVRKLLSASAGPSFVAAAAVGETLFFVHRGLFATLELWRSDGTPEGTKRLQIFDMLSSPWSEPRNLAVAADRLWFTSCDEASGCELWTSDGTEEGTRMAADIWQGPGSSEPIVLGEVDGKVLVAATSPQSGREIWIVEPVHPRRRPVRR